MVSAGPRRRIAVVVQRYGPDINGGAEAHARLLVRTLQPHVDIDVLTSRAADHRAWLPTLPGGIEQETAGVRVIRFDHPRRERGRRRYTPLRHRFRFACRRWLPNNRPLVAHPQGDPASDGEWFLEAQGPTMPGLQQWLRERGEEYSAIIFMTARYHPSAMGVQVRPERSILIPTLHDEKAMYLPVFHRVFRAPRRILFNTRSEQRLAQRLYGDDIAPSSVCGIGVDLPAAETNSQIETSSPYLLYLGRVDRGKGCANLFSAFTAFRRHHTSVPLRLVVAGRLAMPKPDDRDIHCVGFVDEATKLTLLRGAAALVIPSRHESLSMVLLEALWAGTPVIANQHSAVLAEHIAAAGVGQTYADAEEFERAVAATLQSPAQRRVADARRGRAYVEQHYAWPVITRKVLQAIDDVAQPVAVPLVRNDVREGKNPAQSE